MLKNITLLTGLVFLFGITDACFADAASDLNKADSYVTSREFSQAEQLCNSILQGSPDSNSALKAHGKLAVIYAMTQRLSQADTEVNQVMVNYKGNAELPRILYGIMNRYKEVREYQRAQNLSQLICQQYPNSEQASRIQLDSGKKQVFDLIAGGKFQQAEDAVTNLVTTAGTNPAMPATLFKIAREFKEAERNDETMYVYQKIVQGYPNSEFIGRARLGVDKLKIWNLIKAGDVNGAQAGLAKLITDYNSVDDLPHTVHGVALKFEDAGFYDQAKILYQKVKQNYPNDKVAETATVDLKKCDIRAMVGTSSPSAVMQKINDLTAEFSGHWHLPDAVFQIGADYYNLAGKYEDAGFLKGTGSIAKANELYRNAVDILDMVVNTLPSSASTAKACDYAGNCHAKLGEYAKAVQCYEKVLSEYPTYSRNWHALYMLAITYEPMKARGLVPAADADTKIRAAYQQIVDVYPETSIAAFARIWLNNHPL